MNRKIEKVKNFIPKIEWLNEITSRVRNGEIWQHSTFVTYYIFLTMFPLVVGVINGLQYFGRSLDSMIWFVNRISPQPLAEGVISDLGIIYERSNVGIFIFAIISTVWTVSWTMAAVLMGLNKAYGVSHRKNILVLRILAFLLTFVFAGWIGGIVFITQTFVTASVGRWIVFVIASLLTFSLLYYLLPNVKQPYKYVWPGAVFSSLSVLIGLIVYLIFIYYLPEESSFFTLMGNFMVILALIQKVCLAILAGGAINATIMHMKLGEVSPKNEDSKFVRLLVKVGLFQSSNESENEISEQ